ncbi:uncharacterized protein DC041_0010870 [Schistosoma bovis]|uniref:RGS domain-containing protein n=1 Tax=Schistosoma bovis TaxID=6184 RepID=A0A430Q6G3_SCHBO|nr:uncharacterized protein DC041_0010870 [Schistosoma bovis]
MSYPPDASRSCHEADGRSDRSCGSGGATSGSGGGGVYGTLCSAFGGSNWSSSTASYEVGHDPIISVAPSNTNERMISNWKKWSLGLDYLLQDSEGVALFKSYLQYEGCANLLDFWFACQGFRSKVDPSDHRKITQLIKAIYRTYIRGSSNSLNSQPLLYLGKQQSTPVLQNRSEPIRLRSETRHAITERISRKHTLDQTVFDSAQAEVEHFLRTTAYPAFLKSDIYVDFLQTALEGSIRKFPTWEQTVSTSLFPYTGDKQLNTATNLPECPSNMALGGKVLPTLDEDRELQSEELSLLHPSRQACRPACCQILPLTDTAAVTPDHGHCQHCKKCQLYNPCLPLDYSQPILRPPSCYQQSPVVPTSSAAPLTMENLQMTRFYRTELSLQRSYFNPSQNPYVTRPNQEGEPVGHAHVSRACGSTPWRFHNRPNYAYTHWADAMWMSYPPDASRSCHEADGRSDRSCGSGGATSGSGGGGVYGTLCSAFGGSNWSSSTASYEVGHDPIISVAPSNTNERMISNWKKWSLGLDYLLQDSEGVALFKSYLQYEGCANLLDFWFACQGFRSKVDPSDHRKITQLIKAIYRTYIRGSSNSLNSQPLLYLGKQQSTPVLQNRSEPIRLRSETRHAITERISRKHTLDQTVFDSAQAEVEHFLRTTAYPAFLKSDIYVDFLQTALEGSIRKFPTWEQTVSTSLFPYTGDKQLNTATNLPECPSNMALGGKVLPTLDEDRELQSEELSLLHPSRQACRPACCQILPLTDTAAVTPDHGHCQHCKKCQLYNPCLPLDYSQPILRPPSCYQQSPVVPTSSAAPLTMENLQMTRFYRTELSLQRSYFNPSQNPYVTRPNQEGEPVGHAHVSRACGSTPWRFHNRPNYAYTHWADAMCPPSMDPRLGNLPSQPPNPYHISYAPVSARDSEHHSLSSDARTDDTHSHTDSSHDGACNRLRALNHRYPSPFQSSRSHNNNNNSNNSKRQNQLSHHHHHHHHQRHLSTGPQGNSSGVGELMVQCTSPKSSSFPTSFQSRLQQSNPFCRSPIGIGGAGGDSRINYPLETFSTNTSCPTSTAPFTTSNNGNNQGIGEKIAQHSTTDPIINNNKSQQQKHQRRLARRGMSSRPFSDKTKLHNNNNYCTVGSAAAAAAPTAAAGNPTGLNVPVKPSNKSSTSRSYSMAEHDPKAFAQILSEKLQRLLNSQLVTERLDNLMIEVG